ncbi:MAG: hypothetical protein B7Y58_11540 [Halothiobacillus sp. 35-54-62]|nr:MAG: hypothetical protein B7Y58_11540 [Halothiobacillus sp. 35-54-62]OZB48398.1 MAG: hypothetical protein B7X60_04065 [Polynucleobacter sp. 39-45-136]
MQNFHLKSAKDIGQGQQSLKRAISAYNTGNFRNGFANGYVAKVTGSKGVAVGHEGVIQAIRSGSVRHGRENSLGQKKTQTSWALYMNAPKTHPCLFNLLILYCMVPKRGTYPIFLDIV